MLVLGLILAGCGGSSAPKKPQWQRIYTPSFSFQVPRGWKAANGVSKFVASDGADLVQVSAFPLVRPYTSALFTKVETELRARMAAVAKQTGGTLDGHSVVTAAGIRSHSYDVRVGDHLDEYVFVLRGRHEYQLLCRRKSSSSSAVCDRLVSSFALRRQAS